MLRAFHRKLFKGLVGVSQKVGKVGGDCLERPEIAERRPVSTKRSHQEVGIVLRIERGGSLLINTR